MPPTPEEAAAAAKAEAERVNALGEADIEKLIKKAIRKMGLFEDLNLIKTSIAQLAQKSNETSAEKKPADQATTQASNVAASDQPEMKTQKEQLAELRRELAADKQARAKAEESMRQMRIRSEVEAHVLRHLGADSPNAPLVLSHLLPQFSDKDGQTVRKTADEYGADQFVAAKDAVDELFKNELKHLVQTSRAGTLPPTGVVRALPGAQMRGQNANQQQAPRPNAIAHVLSAHFASQGETGLAQQVIDAANKQGTGNS